MPCLNSIASSRDYVQLLKAFYGFFSPVEEAVAPFITKAVLPDWQQRRKANLIVADLAALQHGEEILPVATQLPCIQNLPQAMGALYVMEGSTLGGRGIAKMLLKNNAALLEARHLQFFNGYGAATGAMWTTFVNVLNAFSWTEAEIEEMVAAANQTFYFFKTWLQEKLVHD